MKPEAIRANLDEIDKATEAIKKKRSLLRGLSRWYASQATSQERQALIVAVAIQDDHAFDDIMKQIGGRAQRNGELP